MNILLINHYAGSPKLGMEFRPYYLAREWVKQGHAVTIAAGSFSHLRIQQPTVEGACSAEHIDGIRYVWLKTPAYRGNGLRRAWNMRVFARGLWIHREKMLGPLRPDAVIVSSPHPLPIFSAARIAGACGAKLAFEVRDLWPLTLMELSGISRWNPFILWLQRAENFACRRADAVVSTLPKAAAYLQRHGMAADKFHHVPNGFCIEEWNESNLPLPEQHAAVLASLRESRRFIVGYVGQQSISNALESFVAAAPLVEGQKATLVLIGKGPENGRLQAQAAAAGATNIVFLPPVPKKAVPAALAAMDALFLGWKRQALYHHGISPNKLVDYMMAAKPVIHAVEAGNDPVAESGCGISCPPENPRAIADAIVEMMERRTADERAAMGKRGREYALLHHDYRILAMQFLDVLENTRDLRQAL